MARDSDVLLFFRNLHKLLKYGEQQDVLRFEP